MTTDKPAIVQALYAWIAQRPGLDFGNYGESRSYRAEQRRIARDLHDAQTLLRYVAQSPSITGDDIAAACERAYSGRLSWDGRRLDYCTGQYWPTEYRAAVCAVLTTVMWGYFREPESTGDSIRRAARRCFGRGLASRWFR